MKFSVSILAEGDREVTIEEVVALADAVAVYSGIASGVGAMSYGAQIIVEAENSDLAVDRAIELFTSAVATAQLPSWPVTKAETISESDDLEDEEE